MPPKRRNSKKDRSAEPYRVFVSHATVDKYVARTFCEEIDAIPGVVTFRDDRDLGGGEQIPQAIRAEIRAADELLVLLTPTAITRLWVGIEIGIAYDNEKLIVPIWYNVEVTSISLLANFKGYSIDSFGDYLVDLQERIGVKRT